MWKHKFSPVPIRHAKNKIHHSLLFCFLSSSFLPPSPFFHPPSLLPSLPLILSSTNIHRGSPMCQGSGEIVNKTDTIPALV